MVPVVACLKCGHRSGDKIVVATGDDENLGRGECDNCGRVMLLHQDLCSTCGRAAQGLTGNARDKALAIIKARIEFGDVKSGGYRRVEKSKITDNGEGELKMEKKPCSNCRRTLTLVGNLCSVCRKAAKGKDGEARTTALAEIKTRIDNGDIRARGGKMPHVEEGAGNHGKLPLEFPETLLISEPEGHEIPIKLKLTIEIGIRITGISQAEAVS